MQLKWESTRLACGVRRPAEHLRSTNISPPGHNYSGRLKAANGMAKPLWRSATVSKTSRSNSACNGRVEQSGAAERSAIAAAGAIAHSRAPPKKFIPRPPGFFTKIFALPRQWHPLKCPDVRLVKHQAPERFSQFARPRKNLREQRHRRLARGADGPAGGGC